METHLQEINLSLYSVVSNRVMKLNMNSKTQSSKAQSTNYRGKKTSDYSVTNR